MAGSSQPFGLQARYRRLLGVLKGPVSGRWAVAQVERFLSQLCPSAPETESYLLSLADPLAERASSLDPVGLRPGRLARLAGRLQKAQDARTVLKEHDAIRRAERHLRLRAGLLYGYAGALQQVAECLPLAEPLEVELSEIETGEDPEAPRPRLREALRCAESDGARRELEWMLDRWERATDDGHGADDGHAAENGTWIPVVERLPAWARSGQEEDLNVGGLRHLAVQLYGPAPPDDRLRADVPARGADDPILAGGAVKAARRLLEKRFPRLKGRFVKGHVAFDRSRTGHEGQSADLAIAALFYGAALEHTSRRVRVQIRPEALLTGDVAPDGEIRPVEESSLPVKVRTAFFSPKTRLVVPAEQQEVARAARDKLLEKFPHGQLDILGIGRLEELFYDRRLTGRRRVGWVRHAADHLWDRRTEVALGTLSLGLLALIGALLYGPFDRDPALAEFQGSTLRVENAGGRTLEKLEVGRGLVRKVEDGRAKKPVAFADVVRDETAELFWGASPGEDARLDVLRAKAVGADTLLWERPLRFEVSFPGKPEVSNGTFGIADLLAEDLNRDGSPELYALANHRPYFPSLLLGLDPTDGQVEQRYVHPGHLRSGIKTADLVGGPAPELLVGGHSNAFRDPVLAVLRPSEMKGHAPTRGNYAMGGAGLAAHVAYLRFPSTAVQERRPTDYPMAWQIRPARAAKTLEVVTQDGRVPDEGSGRPRVITTLSFRLEPRSVGTDGTYDQLANSLLQRGVLEAVPGPEALRRYGERVRYWTGSGWSANPMFASSLGDR